MHKTAFLVEVLYQLSKRFLCNVQKNYLRLNLQNIYSEKYPLNHHKYPHVEISLRNKIIKLFFLDWLQIALDALFRFVSSRVLEVDVAGKLVSDMCRGATRSRPELALKKFLPYITNRVKNLASGNSLYFSRFLVCNSDVYNRVTKRKEFRLKIY